MNLGTTEMSILLYFVTMVARFLILQKSHRAISIKNKKNLLICFEIILFLIP